MQEEFTMLQDSQLSSEEVHKLHMLTTPLMRHKAARQIGTFCNPTSTDGGPAWLLYLLPELIIAVPGGLERGHPDTQGDVGKDDILRVQQWASPAEIL